MQVEEGKGLSPLSSKAGLLAQHVKAYCLKEHVNLTT